jgi:hypothetical protein
MTTRPTSLLTLATLLGCTPKVECPSGVLVGDAGNLIGLDWRTPKDATTWVEYGAQSDRNLVTPTQEGTEHGHELWGLPFGMGASWRAISQFGNDEIVCEGSMQTEAVTGLVLEFEATVDLPELQTADPFLMITYVRSPLLLMVIDRKGRPVWIHHGPEGELSSQMDFAQGSTDLLFNTFDAGFDEDTSRVIRVSLEGEVLEEIRTPEGHHSFIELEDGTIAYLEAEFGEWFNEEAGELQTVAGDRVTEIDPDGSIRVIFDVWDHLEPEVNNRWDFSFYDDAKDWTHANSLRHYPERDAYLMSLGNPDIILEIDRATGTINRQYGGTGGYQFAEGSENFSFPHGVSYTPDGTMLMTSNINSQIAAVEYSIDDEAQLLTEVWSHGRDESISALALGFAKRLENGNTLINFGNNGTIREVTADGQVAWEVKVTNANVPFLGDPVLFSSFHLGE